LPSKPGAPHRLAIWLNICFLLRHLFATCSGELVRFMSVLANKLFRFCVVGGIVALADFSSIWLFIQIAPRLTAVAMAYILAVTLHFSLNRWWVFAAMENPAGGQLARYALVVGACWSCTVGITALVLASCTPNVFIAKAAAIPPVTLLGFVLMRSFVFRPLSGGGSNRCTN
jgi:putative flippase GtrA